MNKAEMNDNVLEMVNGGNYGDVDNDTDPNNSMYKKWQNVELYDNFLHTTTTWSVIRRCYMKDGHWVYLIERDRCSDYDEHKEYTASDIERP